MGVHASVFREDGLEKLSPDYIPSRLPHREGHEDELVQLFEPLIVAGRGGGRTVVVHGGSGTGKTVTARRAAQRLVRRASSRGVKLRYVHINCRYASSSFGLVQMLVTRTAPEMPTRGYGASELLQAAYKYLDSRGELLLLVLDDVDQFLRVSGPRVIYEVMRLADSLGGRGVHLILIGLEDASTLLGEQWAKAMVTRLSQDFSPYTSGQLMDILGARAAEAFLEGAVERDVLLFASRVVERFGFGSARHGIELLQGAGLEAEYERVSSVTPEMVRQAQSRIEAVVGMEALEQLQPDHLRVLHGVAQLAGEQKAYIPVEELRAWLREQALIPEGRLASLGEVVARLSYEGFLDLLEGEPPAVAVLGAPVRALNQRLPSLMARVR